MVRTIVRGGGCLCACGLTAVLLASAPGATAPQSGGTGPPPDRAQTARLQPQFRAGVDLVTVDVSVLDANRMPVRGLDVSAFTVFEDGEPQPVVAFAEVDVPGADDMPTGWMRDVAPDVTTNTAAGSRLVIMIFDDAQVRMNPRPNIAARAIGHYVVDRLGSDDLAAIIFTKDNRNAVDFTSDRARNGYSEPKPAKRGKEPSPIASAIAGLLPDSDLPLRMVLAPFAIPGRKQAAVAVVIGLTRPAVDEPMTDDVHLLVGAFTPEGKSRASKALDARVALRPSAGVDAKYEVLARLDLDPGRYQLRVSAQSASLERTGSVYSELVVPDFRKDAVSLSGVVFGARPPLASAGTEALDPIVPIAPTTQRDFAGHAGTAFVRVYQGGKGALAPVPLTTRIVDETGTRVFERTQVLEPGAFGTTRAADHRLDLPVSSLPAGPYLLTFEVALEEQTARRDVRFVVR